MLYAKEGERAVERFCVCVSFVGKGTASSVAIPDHVLKKERQIDCFRPRDRSCRDAHYGHSAYCREDHFPGWQ